VTTFTRPELVASSTGGATYVIDKDPNSYFEARLRLVFDTLGSVNPHVQTIARGYYLGSAAGLAMDPASIDAYVTIPFMNDVIKITFGGYIDRYAGAFYGGDWPAPTVGFQDGDRLTQARFNGPEGIVRDANGALYVADTGNAAIRIISPAGMVSTLPLSALPRASRLMRSREMRARVYSTPIIARASSRSRRAARSRSSLETTSSTDWPTARR
jgi:DNA-binding beta-propeller fold protein YncE